MLLRTELYLLWLSLLWLYLLWSWLQVLLRAERFVLSGTELSVDKLMGRFLSLPSLPPLSAQALRRDANPEP